MKMFLLIQDSPIVLVKKINKALLAICCLITINVACAAKVEVAPNDSAISYVGRFDFSNTSAVSFGHSGSTIEFSFKGESFKIGLQDEGGQGLENKNYYNIIINDSVIQTIETHAALGWFTVKTSSPNKFVKVQIFKRTEATCANGLFYGLKFNEGTIKKSPRNTRKIEWIGDSFTCGYGNMQSIAPPPQDNPNTGFHAENENGYLAFGAITSRALMADYFGIAVSGRGVYRNYDKSTEGTLPKIYLQIAPKADLPVKAYSFDQKMDLIVIKLGTNDFGPEIHATPSITDTALFVTTYIEFIKTVHQKNPSSKIVLAFGGGISDYYPANAKRLTRYRLAMKHIRKKAEQILATNIGFFEFSTITPPYGENYHPTVNAHHKMANEILPYIKHFMKW